MKKLLHWLVWFFLGNVLLFAIIGLRYIGWILPDNFQVLGPIYVGLTWLFIIVTLIGHFALLAFIPLLPVFLLALLIPRKMMIIPLACLIAAGAAWLLLADTIVFSQYRFHLNGVIFEMLLNDTTNEVFNFTHQEWLTAIGMAVIFLLIESGYGIWIWHRLPILIKSHHALRLIVSVVTCLILSWLIFLLSCIQPVYGGISQQPQAFPLYNAILSRLLPIPNSLQVLETAGQAQFIQPSQITKPLNYPLKPMQCHVSQKPLNIVMIVIDSWRFDMLSASVTPQIKKFAPQLTQFMQHYSGGNATQPGIFSLFYGMPGTYWTAMLAQKKEPVLMQVLQKRGYQFGIFSSAKLTVPAFDNTIFRTVSDLALNTPGDTVLQRDRYITAEFKQFIHQAQKTKSQPFFSFLFYDAAHSYCDAPYTSQPFSSVIKECNRGLLGEGSDPVLYLNRYKNALYTVDQQVGEVWSLLKKQGLLENTIVLLTSDHGEEFHDTKQKYAGHASNFTDYQIKVPLLIYWPKRSPQVVTKQTSHYDIAPTLLTEVLGCQNPASDYSVGNMLDSKAPMPEYLQITSYTNFGIRESDRITTIFRTGNFKIDDLQGNPMPGAQLENKAVKQIFEMMNRFYH